MSYLDLPRLVFAGQFQADVSTINNDPEHYDSAHFRSNYQLPDAQNASTMVNGWWNPNGTGAWRFRNCVVTSVVYQDGSVCSNSKFDPVIGLALNGANSRVEGKLVDLDPEQQFVSEIWGFSVNLGNADAEKGLGFNSHFKVAPFADMWSNYPSEQSASGASGASAYYQSVLEQIAQCKAGNSRFLTELFGQMLPDQLTFSIKFNVDAFNMTMDDPNFTFGRVVGSIGLYQPGEPKHFVPGRRLWAQLNAVANDAIGQITGNVLTLDLGNSLPVTAIGGPPANSGTLTVVVLPDNGSPQFLGVVDYLSDSWYEKTAGIVSFTLTADQVLAAQKSSLALMQSGSPQSSAPPVLLQENGNGQWVRADNFVFRFNPSETITTTFYASCFGQPLSGAQISFTYDSSIMKDFSDQAPIALIPGPTPGTPEKALTFPSTLTSDSYGQATLSLIATDPGNPRDYIDGQVYGITYQLGATPPVLGSVTNSALQLNALVFSGYSIPATPDWMSDVRPIFQQYADLYPIMHKIVDLSNYASLTSRMYALKNVFKADIHNPNYMPVTRDLSANKRAMLLKWLDNPHYMVLDSVSDLHAGLQQAIELEHSTIPLYLTALFSIKPGCNVEVAKLIKSVVMEEMLHMALVSNILISIGGSPSINHAKFVPNYPGSLPGGLRGDLTVRLRKCSIEQLRAFMSVEQPDKSVEPVHYRVKPGDPVDPAKFTIGWFYDELKTVLTEMSQSGQISFGNLDRQVIEWNGTGRLYAISNLQDAIRAINEIKHQGEGAGPFQPGDGDGELAHYYKYAEIVFGRRLVEKGDTFAYDGEPIPFDPAGVWPMMDDPELSKFPPGSRAYILSQQFANTYQALLNGLHIAFNGQPAHLKQAVGLMFSLQLAAQQLMETPSGLGDGSTAGPSFQLPFPR